jgi:hypothetical protein
MSKLLLQSQKKWIKIFRNFLVRPWLKICHFAAAAAAAADDDDDDATPLYPQKLALNFADKWQSLSWYSSLMD